MSDSNHTITEQNVLDVFNNHEVPIASSAGAGGRKELTYKISTGEYLVYAGEKVVVRVLTPAAAAKAYSNAKQGHQVA